MEGQKLQQLLIKTIFRKLTNQQKKVFQSVFETLDDIQTTLQAMNFLAKV